MTYSPITLAIILLVAGNLAASLSDVAVKLLEGDISSFQYVFLRQLLSVLLILPFWLKQSRTKRALNAPGLIALRAILILIGSACMMVAITHLPLATANAIFYAAPLIMLPLSVWVLKEIPPMTKVIATMFGFLGVLVVLRPSQFHWAALCALGTATTVAIFNILSRKLPAEQSMVSTLFWTSLMTIPVSGVLAWIYWRPIDSEQLLLVAISASLILAYNGMAFMAYRRAPAGQVALAEYSGLVFAVIIGVWEFDEIPDHLTALGILMIILPLLPYKGLLQRQKEPSK